jgi:hypothetical protein
MVRGCLSLVGTVAMIVFLVAAFGGGSGSTTTSTAAPTPTFKTTAAKPPPMRSCGEEVQANAHASCAFAESVASAYRAKAGTNNEPPSEVAAYSPTTKHSYNLSCAASEQSSLVECKTGNARVMFPQSTGSSHPGQEATSGEDEVGSTSHATDAKFCEEHTCIGSFETEGGTVVECEDGSYSHAGGISGACSSHGGEKRE